MLLIENLLCSSESYTSKINLRYFCCNNGSAVILDGDKITRNLFYAIIGGQADCDGMKLSYDDELQNRESCRQLVSEMTALSFLYPLLSVRENLFYFGGLNGLTKDLVVNKINWFLHYFDITPFWDKRADILSSGEQALINLLCAVLKIPRILCILPDFINTVTETDVENYAQIFHDLQKSGTIFIAGKSWETCFKGPKTELILN